MNSRDADRETVVALRRRGGSLREIRTSRDRTFLVVASPAVERYLTVGTVLTERDCAELAGPAARSAGLELSYRKLSRGDRTEQEIRDVLAAEGIESASIADDIVETLGRRGYIDDRRLAEGYVRYTMRHRPAGPHLLRKRLRDRGVPADIVESVVHDAFREAGERDVAMTLASRRFDRRRDRTGAVRRLHGLLMRRGFSTGVVNDICAHFLRGGTGDENG